MDSEQHQEWYALQRAGKEALNVGDLWILRLVHEPSFDDHHVIGIQRVTRRFPDRLREHGFDVFARTWRRSEDSRKLETPIERLKHPRPLVPTIEERRVPVESAVPQRLLLELDKISVPMFPFEFPDGLDGTGYELSDAQNTLRWWSTYPKTWEPLVMWWLSTWTTLADIATVPAGERPDPADLNPNT